MIVPSLSFPLMINLQKQYGVFHKKQLKYIKKPKQSPKFYVTSYSLHLYVNKSEDTQTEYSLSMTHISSRSFQR